MPRGSHNVGDVPYRVWIDKVEKQNRIRLNKDIQDVVSWLRKDPGPIDCIGTPGPAGGLQVEPVAPDLVSIDSPFLCLEAWENPDLPCKSPIYQKCGLALKRMGISVFWCLLPTMKCLTLRGMRLARRLRAAGIKVIESYPGAAQDLLGIPRKRSSLEELKWGLARAGIKGEYLHSKVTHDEVDAITSALVGLFYMADEYIGLGNAAEGYLIVPRSLRINYKKLSDVLAATGLDDLECPVNAPTQLSRAAE